MNQMELAHLDPATLLVYPMNTEIYRGRIEKEWEDEIGRDKIQSPLLVCRSSNPNLNNFIVCGQRRRTAALTHKMKTVPCLIWECEDVLEFERRLILDNRRNGVTEAELARMYEQLKRIETESAERRQKSGIKQPETLREFSRNGEDAEKQEEKERAPTAAERAAKQIRRSPKTAEKAVEVVHAADKLDSEGNHEAAESIIEALNNSSVAAAVRKVAEVTAPASLPQTEDQQHSKDIDRLTAKLTGLLSQVEKFAGELFVAIDQKKKTSPAFANRHAKFANLLRKFGDTLDPCLQGAGVIETAWIAARKQVDNQ